MTSLITMQQKLFPDLLAVMQKRYRILQHIRLTQPIGRRALSQSLTMTERVLRGEVDLLKAQNLLIMSASGMSLTEEGLQLLVDLDEWMKEITGIKRLEKKLMEKLNVKEVVVVTGDSDQSSFVEQEMGRAAVMCLKKHVTKGDIIAVTGGTTLAEVAEMMTVEFEDNHLLFVPARGGVGERVEFQANTICAKMAERAGGEYRLLHVPDEVSEDVYESLIQDSRIKELLSLIKSSSIVIHGIGDAITMAERRRTKEDIVLRLMEEKAVAEAFGYYFNQEGEVVHSVKTVGIQLEDLNHAKCVVAVAGGTSKALSIQAFMKQGYDTIVVTDEAAAKELLKGISF